MSGITVDLGTFSEDDAMLIATACEALADDGPDDTEAEALRAIAAQVRVRLNLARKAASQAEPVVLDAAPYAFPADVRVGDVLRTSTGIERVVQIARRSRSTLLTFATDAQMSIPNGGRVAIVTFAEGPR